MSKSLISTLLNSDNYFSINKSLVKSLGFLNAAVLQELISKYSHYNKNDELTEYGFFYSESKIADDFGISESTAGRIIDQLVKLELITKSRKGVPARVYYDLPDDILEKINRLTSSVKMTELEESKCTNKISQKERTFIREERNKKKDIEDIKKTSNKFDADEYIKSLNLSDNLKESLLGLLEIRKIKKTATTQRAIDTIVRDLDRWYEGNTSKKVECVDQSVKSGWTGVFEIKAVAKQSFQSKSGYRSNDLRRNEDQYKDF